MSENVSLINKINIIVNSRFEKIESNRRMSNFDWAAWVAINAVYKSAIKSKIDEVLEKA